ncbi:hypothetical protein [Mycobacterium intracellulare]|uniref:hypothetical protein n=1 Tax=Mycobacterium intracellulare TaxID=1767 RepID=UPI0004462966|nr:hypothetical protein [Mycobacterium intracellulare]ETZ33176.1 hypothetical protein L843_3662 [Mycobacterium intracellulare MIN_061107_1834]MCA2273615.1 hypothetical protein [Mycobacterium intracellulare]MCA2325718.1 hypothetical protein [Mycobacterium intracellulare]UEB26550.1 hypothetical protein LK403_10425 [Mycobacterium intracellulare]WVL05520.1 hypothetical protein KN247_25900 [Mycobacterium intracellulare]
MTNDTFTDAAPTLTMRQRLDAIAEAAIPPEYFVAQRIASEAKELLKHLAPPAAELPHPLDSGEIRDEWIDETAELETRRQQMERRRGVLLTLLRDARMRAQHLRASQTQNVLAALNDELKALLAQVEQISNELGDVETAQDAIAHDAGPQWKRLTELADDYAELRQAQLGLMSSDDIFDTTPADGEDHASDLFLKNLDDLWPGWRKGQARDGQRINIDGTPTRNEPWPADPTALLLWLVRSNAEAWIPTAGDLERLRQRRVARANPAPRLIRDTKGVMNKPLPAPDADHGRIATPLRQASASQPTDLD